MNALLEGEVLRVDTERVEADWLEDPFAGEALKASVDVRARKRIDVAHVEPLGGGVGEHHQLVVPIFGSLEGVAGEAVGALLIPTTLPLGLYFGRCVAAVFVAAHLCVKEGRARRPKQRHPVGSVKSPHRKIAPLTYTNESADRRAPAGDIPAGAMSDGLRWV